MLRAKGEFALISSIFQLIDRLVEVGDQGAFGDCIVGWDLSLSRDTHRKIETSRAKCFGMELIRKRLEGWQVRYLLIIAKAPW